MRKILVIHYGGEGGVRGSEACVIQSIQALKDAGYGIAFIRNLPVIDNIVRKNVEEIIEVEIPNLFIDGLNTTLPLHAYFAAFQKIAGAIKRIKPSLMYLNGGLPCQLGVPLGRLFKIPTMCHYHHPANRRYYYCWLVPWADKHIFPSKFTQSDARHKANISGDVVYNGVNIDRFAATQRDQYLRDSLSIHKNAIVVGQVGQLAPTKRPGLLLSAFSEAVKSVPSLHLCLVGRGPLEAQLRRTVIEYNLQEKVTVTGYVEEVLPYYQHVFDINMLVSSEEGLGISILEGAACALPSIISDCTGLSETIIPNVTGLAFDPNDEKMLVESIITMASNKEFRQAAGSAGRRFIEDHFSLQQYQTGIVGTVAKIIENCS